MCGGPDKSESKTEDMNTNSTAETEDSFTRMLLELASNNDVEGRL